MDSADVGAVMPIQRARTQSDLVSMMISAIHAPSNYVRRDIFDFCCVAMSCSSPCSISISTGKGQSLEIPRENQSLILE